jgi:uroporphyrinogen decarboxylase
MPPSPSDPTLLLRALRGEPLPRPPVWFMRQAGRYMAVYRELRARVSFLELCHDADLCAEVAVQPMERFGFDAAIVFSDILLPLEAMGAALSFGAGHGPRIANPVRDRAAVRALRPLDPALHVPEPAAAIRTFRRLRPEPILGFAGAPFTLACYLVQGHGGSDWPAVRAMMAGDPDTFQALLDLLADAAGDHLQHQIDAGAAAVQLFDTWAGVLSPEEYRRFALPAAARALARAKGAPRIYFARSAGPFLDELPRTGADAIGLDWQLALADARRRLGTLPVQGNLDPAALELPPDDLRAAVHAVLRAAGPRGHVFNLGHGIAPHTPVAGVEAAVEAVKSWRWS